MFVLRRAKIEDIPTLLKLAKMVHFINLPADKDIIADKVTTSRRSFLTATQRRRAEADGRSLSDLPVTPPETRPDRQGGESANGLAAITTRSDLFMFVLEDTESGGILGTSQIISRMGGPGAPNVFFQLERREFFSRTLQQGGTHVVAKLVLDETGPTEIGGLILQPSYRGHKMKLGRFLSLARFHFIGLHRGMFSDRVLAEMMAPITPDGRSTLWEYLGRRFINLTYDEADRFCQYSKEFMTSLLPREEIYLTLLPPEARSVVGEVGPETLPARRMLERLGFTCKDRIDPFDGGPNLDVATDDIPLVRDTRRAKVGPPIAVSESTRFGMVSRLDEDGEFRAMEIPFEDGRGGAIRIAKSAMKLLQIAEGSEVGVTPTPHPLRPVEGSGRRPIKEGRRARRSRS
ncbi:MAG: arginine N-succinyltransferase [Phycisphaeraceae bacterium]|nr:arginine N-succinyltransferase [Phycisphaeraceae bacterium]